MRGDLRRNLREWIPGDGTGEGSLVYGCPARSRNFRLANGEGIDVSFPDGSVRRTRVAWTETNVLADSVIDLRVGDSLLLTALSPGGEGIHADVAVEGETLRCDGAPVPYRFQKPGVVLVKGRRVMLLVSWRTRSRRGADEGTARDVAGKLAVASLVASWCC